ncbi:hypothetical protein VRRI112168_14265 [Vreelandella rituensis]
MVVPPCLASWHLSDSLSGSCSHALTRLVLVLIEAGYSSMRTRMPSATRSPG